MIKLLVSDLDGTIIDNHNQVTNADLEAIYKINNLTTVKFSICTGKTYRMTRKLCQILNPSYGIFGNGIQIINLKTGEEIFRQVIPNHRVIECIKLANRKNLHVHIYTEEKIITQQQLKYIALRNYQLYKDQIQFEIVESLEDYIMKQKPSILKLVISAEKELKDIKNEIEKNEDLTAIQIRKYNEYKDKFINQQYEYLDIVPKHVTKYDAIQQLAQYLDIKCEEVLAIGDNINDIEMIKHAGIGVAIGGSYQEVEDAASYVTKNTVKNGGFAEAIDRFILIEQ